ncbi:MAG: radical SAM protein [Planctomycetota bacterium]|nr:radical SAM protein [Planctomycetota bacterium]
MELPETERHFAAMHDFSAKLRQPSAIPVVQKYLQWQREVRAAAVEGVTAPAMPSVGPLSINLDLTTACNYACDHCIDWDALNLAVRHDDVRLREAILNLVDRGLQSVILLGGGEPTLYPGFGSMVRFLKEQELQVAVVTNGSNNEKIAEVAECFTEGDWVRLSLDSGSDEIFQAMHHPKGRGIDLDQICASAQGIKRRNPAVQLGYSFVITWLGSEREAGAGVIENLEEMESATLRAKQYGFDYISFKPFLTRAEEGAEVMDPDQASEDREHLLQRLHAGLKLAKSHEEEFFRVVESINLRVFLDGTWKDYTAQPRTCHMQALRQVLSPLGVFNCPAHRGVEKGRVGKLDAWALPSEDDPTTTGSKVDFLPAAIHGTTKLLANFNATAECREVTCLYNPVNRFLEDLVVAEAPLEDLLEGGPDCGDCFL